MAAVTAIRVWLVHTLEVAFYAADVLFAGPQRGHVGAATVDIDGLAHQATGQPAHVGRGAGEETEVGTPESEAGPEGLALADHHIGPQSPTDLRTPAATGSTPTTIRAPTRSQMSDRPQVLDASKVVGITGHHHARGVVLAVGTGPSRNPIDQRNGHYAVAGAHGTGGQ